VGLRPGGRTSKNETTIGRDLGSRVDRVRARTSREGRKVAKGEEGRRRHLGGKKNTQRKEGGVEGGGKEEDEARSGRGDRVRERKIKSQPRKGFRCITSCVHQAQGRENERGSLEKECGVRLAGRKGLKDARRVGIRLLQSHVERKINEEAKKPSKPKRGMGVVSLNDRRRTLTQERRNI